MSAVSCTALRGERGSVLPLVVFYGVLCLIVVFLAASASSLYLERERLYAVADGASLAGADAWDPARMELTDAGPRVRLTSAAVRDAAHRFVGSAAGKGLEGLRVERADTEDGHSATVTLSAVWRPPVAVMLIPSGVRVVVTSHARGVFG